MATRVRVENKIDFDASIQRKLRAIEDNIEPALQEEITRMIVRTTGGTDVSGAPFVPYSDNYRKFKVSKGRNASPDLTFTGRMLNSITNTVRRVGDVIRGEIFFASPQEAAKAQGNQRYRKFFGLSEEQIARIQQRVRDGFRIR